MDKDTTWEMEDYRSSSLMVELPEELPLVGTLHEELYNKTRVANEELGIFLKLLNRQNSEAADKARIPKLQENLLKRTAKIETQAGAAKQKLVARGKKCCS
jgi:hypothetical protein